MRWIHFILFSCAILFGSCGDQNLVFEQNVEIPNAQWSVKDKAKLSLSVTDTVSQNNFFINVRNTEEYPYRNLYVFVNTTFPNGQVSRDTVGIILADATGAWLGSGSGFLNSSQNISNTIMYKYSKRFPISGDYEIEIEQAMRTDTLTGIRNIGIRIESVI